MPSSKIILTESQEKFAQNIVKGKTQVEAYMDAYPSSRKWEKQAVYNKASNLIKVDKIIVRINELKQAVTNGFVKKAEWDRKKALDNLQSLYSRCILFLDDDNAGGKAQVVNACTNIIKELNKLYGLYPDNVAEVTVSNTVINNSTANINLTIHDIEQELIQRGIDIKNLKVR